MGERPQNKHLKSYAKLPEGVRATKALRFTLPEHLADRLESMAKAERDELLTRALEQPPT